MPSSFAFNMVKLNGSLLTGISSPSFDRREIEKPLAHDATLHQTGASVIRTAPMASFTTVAMRALFSILGTGDEVPFIALDGTNGLELIGGKIATAAPGYLGTSTHASRKMASGDAYLRRVSWTPGDVARAEMEVFGIGATGSTDPAASATVALPTLPTNTEQMVLSGLSLNGFAPTEIASLDIQITHQGENNDDEICYNTGLPHPVLCKRAGVGGATEVILTAEILDLTSTWTNGAVAAVFTSLATQSVGLGSPTATVTINTPLIREKIIRGEDGRPAKRQITARGLFDGTNRPITITTG